VPVDACHKTLAYLSASVTMRKLLAVAVCVSTFLAQSLCFTSHQVSIQPKNSILLAKRKKSDDEIVKSVVQFNLHPSIQNISAQEWDGCLATDGSSSPFLEHAWLRCLEESKCIERETGWVPRHVSIKMDGEVCGFVPLYIKAHSMGEFIFDSGWADAAQANNIDYYPKLLVGIPFTPATGTRILLNPSILERNTKAQVAKLRKMLSIFLKKVARENKLSSVHINFLTEEEAEDIAGDLNEGSNLEKLLPGKIKSAWKGFQYLDQDQYHRRTSLQYHWTNSNSKDNGLPYKSFEEYLMCFKSKRRITIRRERQKVQVDADIRIDAVVGKDILKCEGLVQRMFEIYRSTIDKMFWGNQYLSLDFFNLLAKSDFIDNICFMCARRRSSGEPLKASDVIAGTFNVVKDGVFYGRYWGCLEEVKNLHFETCYWSAIDYCIQNGLRRMEPGAGGGGKLRCQMLALYLVHVIGELTRRP
jgi:predicted N-acyltransferase